MGKSGASPPERRLGENRQRLAGKCRLSKAWASVPSCGIGKRPGANPKLRAHGRFVEGRLWERVSCEQLQDLSEQRRISHAVPSKEDFPLFRREFDDVAESGFDLLVSFWRHVCPVEMRFATQIRGQLVRPASQPPTLPGNFGTVPGSIGIAEFLAKCRHYF